MKNLSIGIFDSGIGGFTVMQSILHHLPHATVHYFGDTARLPYGDKNPDTILKYTRQSVDFLIQKDIDIVVLACNTASAYSATALRSEIDIPLYDVIACTATKAASVTSSNHIAVLGTSATIKSNCYSQKLNLINPSINVTSIPCPLFVPLIEEQRIYHSDTALIIAEYLKDIQNSNVDTVILGCTHYSILKNQIQDFLGPNVTIIGSAECCAEQILANVSFTDANSIPKPQFYVTNDNAKFHSLACQFFGDELDLENVKLVEFDAS